MEGAVEMGGDFPSPILSYKVGEGGLAFVF